jgi:hypothetical protein
VVREVFALERDVSGISEISDARREARRADVRTGGGADSPCPGSGYT